MRKLVVLAVALLTCAAVGVGSAEEAVEPKIIPLDPKTLEPVADAEEPAPPAPSVEALPAAEAEAAPAAPAEAGAAPAAPAEAEAEAAAAAPAEEGEAPVVSPETAAAYTAAIKDTVAKVRKKVLAKVEGKLVGKQEASMGRFSMALFIFSFAGVLLLAMPLFLRKKYPGKGALLFKYSALAAGAFFVAVNLFAFVLLLQRTAQGETAKLTNPQVAITSSALDMIDQKAGDLAGLALMDPSGSIQQTVDGTLMSLEAQAEDDPAVAALGEGAVDPEARDDLQEDVRNAETLPVLMLRNVQVLLKDVKAFKAMASAFKKISWIFGYLPIILTALGLVIFVLGIKPILTEIVTMPARAASGDIGAGKQLMRNTLRRLGGTFIATLCGIAVLLVTAFLAATILVQSLQPAIEAFMAFLFMNLLYVFSTQDGGISSTWIYMSLGLTGFFLVLNITVLTLGTGMFFGKLNKIFMQRFVDRVPLRAHRKFFIWGTISYAWVVLFPLLYSLAGVPLAKKVMDWTFQVGENGVESWPKALSGAPLSLVLVFLIAFFALQGFRAIKFMAKYKVKAPPPPPVAQQPQQPADFWSPPAAAA